MKETAVDLNLTISLKQKTDEIIAQTLTRNEKLLAIALLLKEGVYHYDWVGFYIMDHAANSLYLGPYVGAKTDHVNIAVGKGICGQVAASKKTMVVQDVTQVENYLSCSINVQSEIVLPILRNNEFLAELDIDSHSSAPFTSMDIELLEYICQKLEPLF